MFRPIENFHSAETFLYEQSPFNSLIEETFPVQNTLFKDKNQPQYLNILETGEDALLTRIYWIRQAKKSILIQTFIWHDDESGRYVMAELIKAAQRGVKVKILIDAMGATKNLDLLAYFADSEPNLELRLYNPNSDRINPPALMMFARMALKFDEMNKRMHNKTLIVDDQIVIMGGRNYQNDYFDRNRFRNFKDRDVMVIGPVVKTVTDSFSQYWSFYQSIKAEDLIDIGKKMVDQSYKKQITAQNFEFGDLFKDIEEKVNDREFIKTHFVDNAFKANNVLFLADIPGKNFSRGLSNGSKATDELMALLKEGQEEIIFQTPYLVLDGYLLKGIKKAIHKKPFLDVIVSTNSLASTDHITAYAQALKQKSQFLDELHFRIFELKPVPHDIRLMLPNYQIYPETFFPSSDISMLEDVLEPIALPQQKRFVCIHSKSLVIDGKTAWIGSFNLDPRSAHLNTELGLLVRDGRFARTLRSTILQDIKPGNSWTVGIKPGIPVVKQVNVMVDRIMSAFPVGDVWPFEHITLYDLVDKGVPMPYYADDFYKNYKDVGSFPEVSLSKGQIQLILLKAFIGIAKPLI